MVTLPPAKLLLALILGLGFVQPSAQRTAPTSQEQQLERVDQATRSDANPNTHNTAAPTNQPVWWRDPVVVTAIAAAASAVVSILIFVVYIRQWRVMRDGLIETKKSADAAKKSADAQLTALQLLYAPRIELRNPSAVMLDVSGEKDCAAIVMYDHPDSVKRRGEAYLRITWGISNVGSNSIRFTALWAQSKIKGGDWRSCGRIECTVGPQDGIGYTVEAGELTSENQGLFCTGRLIVSVQFNAEIYDPVERQATYYTFRRKAIYGHGKSTEVMPLGDPSDWPESKGETS
jgi:hypothetical protein